MGAGASTELTKDQLKEKYTDVKHRLYPEQQADVEAKFEATENPAEILECVNNHLNNPEVPNLNLDEKPTFTDMHKSLMSQHLTPELFTELKAAGATSKGYTISRAIQTGLMTPHLGVGITAGDEESWELFKSIYNPIIKGWHGFDPDTQNHASDLDPSKLTMTDDQVCLDVWGGERELAFCLSFQVFLRLLSSYLACTTCFLFCRCRGWGWAVENDSLYRPARQVCQETSA